MENNYIGDSCVDFNKEEDFFTRVPFNITINETTFIDDSNLKISDLINAMNNFDGGVKTSCPSPQLFMEKFDENKNNYVVCISSKVSGCYNSACSAKDMFLEEHPNANVYVFDSKTCAAGENNVMLKIKELAESGIPFNEVCEQVESFIKKLESYSVFTQYDNLVKNGRIKSIIAKGVKFFNIYPIMGTNDEGEFVLKHLVKGQKKALQKIYKLIEDSGKDVTNCIFTITSMECHEKAMKLKALIEENFKFKDVRVYDALGLSIAYGDIGGMIFSF